MVNLRKQIIIFIFYIIVSILVRLFNNFVGISLKHSNEKSVRGVGSQAQSNAVLDVFCLVLGRLAYSSSERFTLFEHIHEMKSLLTVVQRKSNLNIENLKN